MFQCRDRLIDCNSLIRRANERVREASAASRVPTEAAHNRGQPQSPVPSVHRPHVLHAASAVASELELTGEDLVDPPAKGRP